MPFFRDELDKEPDEFLFHHQQGLSDAERMENAKWLYQCGWFLDAFHIIHSIAKSIPDEDPRQTEETSSYEETRFGKENNEEERADGRQEGIPDAGYSD